MMAHSYFMHSKESDSWAIFRHLALQPSYTINLKEKKVHDFTGIHSCHWASYFPQTDPIHTISWWPPSWRLPCLWTERLVTTTVWNENTIRTIREPGTFTSIQRILAAATEKLSISTGLGLMHFMIEMWHPLENHTMSVSTTVAHSTYTRRNNNGSATLSVDILSANGIVTMIKIIGIQN